MGRRAGAPEVNAGSMADIAFLLLIFFLVTTTIDTDAGLDRMLPPIEPPEDDVVIKQKNIFQVSINKSNQLMADEELTELKDLRAKAIAFLDNNGDGSCTYCKGKKEAESSDNPSKAIISLKNDRETKYSTYITVQNELVGAYNELRNREAQRLFNRTFVDMEAEFLNPESKEKLGDAEYEELKEKVKRIQDLFPQKLSEAETTAN
ncbi:MAG: ExbD/TolR family protein [Flavobacteriaceae bacterium]